MSTNNLKRKTIGLVEYQSGDGIPNHVSPLGSTYTDTTTGYRYKNTNGSTSWSMLSDRSNYVLVKSLSDFPTPSSSVLSQNFELNSISPFTTSGSSNWATQSSVVNTGSTYAAKSGVITHNQTTQMSHTVLIPNVGATLSFYYKVSSESGFDFLTFYVDGVQQTQWSGEVGWAQQTYNLSGGNRTLKWEYSKDGSDSAGTDAAYIDDIIITANSPIIYLDDNYSYEINGSVNIGNNVLQLGTSNIIFGLDKSDDIIIYTGSTSFINNINKDVSINNLTFVGTVTGSSVLNFIGTTNKIEIKDNIFFGNKNLGSINGGDITIFRDNLISTNQSGITFTGIFDNTVITDNIFVDNVGNFSLMNFINASINNLFIGRNQIELVSSQTGITTSNLTLVTNGNLSNNIFLGTGTSLNGFSHNTTKWLFTGNQGIPNRTREIQFTSTDMTGLVLSSPATAAAATSYLSTTGSRFYTFRGGAGQDDGLAFSMQIPSDYYSGGRFDFNVTTDTTALNFKLFMALSKITVGTDFSTIGETGLNVVSAGVTQFLRKEVSISPITTTFSGGDVFTIKVWRDPDDAQDTTAASVYLNNVQFVYNSI